MKYLFRLLVMWPALMTELAIRRHGFQPIYVGRYGHTLLTRAYTIGFQETFGSPEILIFDLPPQAALETCWGVAEDLKAGMVIEDGAQAEGFDGRCVWRRIHPDNLAPGLPGASLRRRLRKRQGITLDAFQLVLSDRQGFLPWEDGYDESIRARQPALWLPPEQII